MQSRGRLRLRVYSSRAALCVLLPSQLRHTCRAHVRQVSCSTLNQWRELRIEYVDLILILYTTIWNVSTYRIFLSFENGCQSVTIYFRVQLLSSKEVKIRVICLMMKIYNKMETMYDEVEQNERMDLCFLLYVRIDTCFDHSDTST